MEILIVGIISYLMGSIPFGLVLTKIFLKKDIRKIGSGNIGATNALRTGNKICLLYTSPSPRDAESSRMPSSA